MTNDGPIFNPAAVDFEAQALAEHGRGIALLQAMGCDLTITAHDGRCAVTATLSLRD